MPSQADKRLLILVVFVFGVVETAAAIRWLSTGSIVIRKGGTRISVGGGGHRPVPQGTAPAAGTIGADDVLYYPLCVTWLALGVSMIALSVLAFTTSNELYFKLSAYSCVAVLLLGFGTVAAALWSGP